MNRKETFKFPRCWLLRLLGFVALLCLPLAPENAYAHDWAEITDALWAPDESQFLLGYSSGTEAGFEEQWLKLYAVTSAKVVATVGGDYDPSEGDKGKAVRTRVRRARRAFRQEKDFLIGGWLVPDPMTYRDLPWPGWPPTGKKFYRTNINITGQSAEITLEVYSTMPGDGKKKDIVLLSANCSSRCPHS